MLHTPIPCKNCITFPICINEYRNYRLKDIQNGYKYSSLSKSLARAVLKDKCSIISNYMGNHENLYGFVMGEFKKLFEDESWNDDEEL